MDHVTNTLQNIANEGTPHSVIETKQVNHGTICPHPLGLTCVDFHPYGDFLSSGSHDTNLKLWDIRRKGCIFTYKGHRQKVNSVKFSPDGQWIASAGEEGAVKVQSPPSPWIPWLG